MTAPLNQSMTTLEWVMLISLSILWGGSFFFVGVVVDELPSLTIVLLRVGIAAIVLRIVLLAVGISMPTVRSIWSAFFIMGFLNNVIPFTLIVWGQHHIASGLASILNATTPLFTVIVAHYFTIDEKITPSKIIGAIFGFLGVVILLGSDLLGKIGIDVTAQLAILGAAISYAFAGIFGRRFKRMNVDPLATATGQVSASAIMLIPLVMFIDLPWTLTVLGPLTWLAIFALAVLSTALAYVLYFRILATAGATNLLLVSRP